ncbi:MAG: hypothetical protein QF903_13975 [Planctomycetota bacterium]|jgi:hypothetical protein|nr:hypothetical protein [Planctomycetota bacterium]MDP6763217.1 hypothetical protein [Planctomycetota bacterium]MDP6990574.1 hypothetical protein [Planctomycetota bacterium]
MTEPASDRERSSAPAGLSESVRAYLAASYPANHAYTVKGGRLRPGRKLRRRWRKIAALYPAPLASLADLSSSKGYFVLEAAGREECERALGIDVHTDDLDAAESVRAHLALSRARFLPLRLAELAERIDELGGRFQTVLLINTYPYLYFGSRRSEQSYPDHDELFELLRSVCAGRLIFSNRVSLERCPRHIQERARARGLEAGYTEEAIRRAARSRFELTEHGRLLRGIPLWTLTPR